MVDFFRKLMCRIGWHTPKQSSTEVAGINIKSICSRCNRSIMLDSQGNWF